MKDSTYQQLEERVRTFAEGEIFFPDSLSDLGTSDAVRSALVRLCRSGQIVRVAQGIYCKPKIDTKWGLGVMLPGIREIARAIAKRDRVQIVPCEDYVLNLLGLSSQVPVNAVFLTNGSPRRIKVGEGQGILFQHTTEMRIFAYQSEMMQFVVMAVRAIGENRVTEEQMRILVSHLNQVPEEDYKADINLAPIWVRNLLNSWKEK